MAPATHSRTWAVSITTPKRAAESETESATDTECLIQPRRKTYKLRKVVHHDVEVQSSKPVVQEVRPGLLTALLDMPLDVLEEIFLMCDPATLVNVSRTNKAFCRLLQSSVYNQVWREVFAREGIPEAQEGWSLVKWAGLLFGERCCQICLGPCLSVVSLDLFKHLCERCIRTTMVSYRDRKYSGGIISAELFEEVIPTVEFYYTAADGLLDSAAFAYESDINAFVADLDAARSESAQHEKAYIDRRIEEYSSRMADIERLEKWHASMLLLNMR